MEELFLGENLRYPLSALKKHFIALGASGSGKTVLCKALVEEAVLQGIPSILVDPQGDLASLAIPARQDTIKKFGLNERKVEQFSKVQVVIYTPTSSKGVPLCINPLKLPPRDIENEEAVSVLNQIANAICKLAGYNLDNDKGKNAQAIIYLILLDSYKNRAELETFDRLADLVLNIPDAVKEEAEPFLKGAGEVSLLAKKIKFLTIGEKELLFQFGTQLNIPDLLKNKNRINIIYLNTLEGEEEKDFFVSTLVTSLYEWMLTHPSEKLQALFFIDEISSYIPAGNRKTLTKGILTLLFKQARKYGVGCIASTQNPGDIDYKVFSQIGSWAVGRLTTKQDMDKVSLALKSLTYSKLSETINQFPQLQPGEFFLFCPDAYKKIEKFSVRRLLTEHKTLTEDDVKNVTPEQAAQNIKQPKTAPTTTKSVKGSFQHFNLNVLAEQVDSIISKKKKKMFFLVGPQTENLESVKLVLKPIFKTKVTILKKTLFSNKFEEIEAFFDGLTGDIMIFDGEGFEIYKWNALIGMKDTELSFLKTAMQESKGITNADIASKLHLTENFVDKTANDLMKKRAINYFGKAGRAYLWKPLIKIKLPKKLESSIKFLTDKKIEGEIQQAKVKVDDIAKLVKCWFNGTIIDHTIIYYPVYEVSLVGKKGKRKLKISGVDGQEIE
ncbi:ATP-binding protein [Candidatus Woesearchaeota archaeon]|nr:ATP-binding protein [Candidatus Woesearchaeota archaeon]